MKVFDSELKIMDVLWENGDLTAGQLAQILREQIGWNRNTTYTVIGKLVEKGAIERYGDNFSCKALITKSQVRHYEAAELLTKLFDGSVGAFVSAFAGGNLLTEDEIENIKQTIKMLEQGKK
jgi:predicted transcriptional regulator